LEYPKETSVLLSSAWAYHLRAWNSSLQKRAQRFFVWSIEAGVGGPVSAMRNMKGGGQAWVFSCEEVFGRSDLLLKVARPLKGRMNWLRPETIPRRFSASALSSPGIRIDVLAREKSDIHVPMSRSGREDGSLCMVLRPFSQIGGAMTARLRPPAPE